MSSLLNIYQLFSEFDVNVFEAILTIQSFQTDQIQISSRKIFTAHYACRNADFNFTLVMGTTKGFIFQIINSLMESWGLRMGEESRAAFSPSSAIPFLARFLALWPYPLRESVCSLTILTITFTIEQ